MSALFDFKACQLRRLAETDDPGNVFGAAAAVAFLFAARQQRVARFALHHQCADALRAAQLVRREADRVHVQLRKVQFQFTDHLGRVGMHQAGIPVYHPQEFGQWLDHPGFVVGHDHRQDLRPGFCNGLGSCVQVDATGRIRLQKHYRAACGLQLA